MKRLIFTLALPIVGCVGVLAQSSLSIVYLNRDVWGNTDANYIQAAGTVENVSDQTVVAKVRAQEISIVPGTVNYFCWAQCYEPGVLLSPSSITLEPGQRMDDFYGDYVPQGQAGISTVKYCFFNVANENDSACGIVRYNASPLGIDDLINSGKPGVSEAYPNPAVDEMTLSYVLGAASGQIDIFSMLGAKVKTVKLSEPSGKVNMKTEHLPAGMYLYRLSANGKDIQTRKFLVTK
jgi:hypothetical protein